MKKLSRSLVALAIAGHVSLAFSDAFAAGPSGASGPAGGHGGVAGVGASGGYGGGVTGGHGDNGGGVTGGGGGGVNFVPPVFNYQPSFNSFEANASGCGWALQLPDLSWWSNPIDGVAAISQQTQDYLRSCGCDTQSCVADALDQYADALEKIVSPPPPPPGPPGFAPPPGRSRPRRSRTAADRPRSGGVRARREDAARGGDSVKAAIEDVKKNVEKTISLMRAADTDGKFAVTRGAVPSPQRSRPPPTRSSAPTPCRIGRNRRAPLWPAAARIFSIRLHALAPDATNWA